jgi:phospholipid/cholesterol/gamma-HCH transport system permease protein
MASPSGGRYHGLVSSPFLRRTLHAGLLGRPYVALTIEHLQACLDRAGVPILVVIAPMGAVIALQGLLVFAAVGAREMIGSMLVGAMLLEVAPAFVALLLATQVGSAYATELGSMVVLEETDYHEVIGVDPYARLVVPRVAGLTLAAPLLVTVAAATGVAVGLSLAVTLGNAPPAGVVANIREYVVPRDVLVCLGKATAFALTTGLVSCQVGLAVRGGAAEVGRAANRAIVRSILVCVVLNYVLATLFLGGGLT